MTYKQLTKQIKDIEEQIDFMKNIESDLSDKEDVKMCGYIIDNLMCWKNTLIFDKEYVAKEK